MRELYRSEEMPNVLLVDLSLEENTLAMVYEEEKP